MKNGLARLILFLMVGVGAIVSFHYTENHFKSGRAIILLNRTMPDFHPMFSLHNQAIVSLPKARLKEYLDYYRAVTEAMPDNAEGMLMLGYLYEIKGDKKRTEVCLKEAHRLDNQFFFIEYNLALFLFKQGDYLQSVTLLQKALATPPEVTLKQMVTSTIYRQIFASKDDDFNIISSLGQAYQDANVVLGASMARLKATPIKEIQQENVNLKVHARIM